MVDLTTRYLGMTLKNPLVPSASPLSKDLDSARRLEDAGAAAIVMYSLFEEEIKHHEHIYNDYLLNQDIGHAEASSFLPVHEAYRHTLDDYLEQIDRLKKQLAIPVIASLNGITNDGWITHARSLESAGADALELNMFFLPTDFERTAGDIENDYLQLCRSVRKTISIPIAVKLSPQFSSLPNFVSRLGNIGIQGLVLFNRFYQPDIDPESLRRVVRLTPSTASESLLPMRWISLLYHKTPLSLAASSGLHSAEDVIKLVMAGADITQLCSCLLQHGPAYLGKLLADTGDWMEEQGYESLREIQGRMSLYQCGDMDVFSRVNYVQTLMTGQLD